MSAGFGNLMNKTAPGFPIFISLEGESVLIAGGGKIAARRAAVLSDFGAAVTVIAPEISSEMRNLLDRAEMRGLIGRIIWRQERYAGIDQKCALIIAATNVREVNRQIGEDARKAGVPVSVADRREESTFWFPAIMRADGLVAGMVSEAGDHGKVRKAAQKIRESLEGI